MNEQLHNSYDLISVDSKDESNQEGNLVSLQKKFLKLNNSHSQDKHRVQTLIHENELLKLEIEEKERTCIKLHKEIDSLQQHFLCEKLKYEIQTKMTEKNGEKVESSKNIKAIPIERRAISMTNANFLIPKTLMNTDNASKITREEEDIVNKLADEVNYFKKQHQLLAEKLKKSEESYLDKRNLLLDQEIKNKRLETEISKQKDFIVQLKKSVDNNLKLSIELEISKNHIAEQENTISLLEIKCKELEKLLKMKNQSINELEELNDLSKNQLNEYSSALAFHIGQAEKLKRNCQMFRLNRIGNLGSFLVVPTLLIIRRDLDGNYIIELEDNYSKIVLDAKDIIELSLCKENINKFRLIYKIPRENNKVSEKEEFESEDPADDVCKAIKEFLEKANFYDKEIKNEENKNKNCKKNFFSELVLFFS